MSTNLVNPLASNTANTDSPRCLCGLASLLKVARTEANFGRRFHGCQNFKVPAACCDFFMWRDGPTPDHLKALLIEYYHKKEMYKQRYHKMLEERDTMLCELTVLEGHCKEVGTELDERRKECKSLEEELKFGNALLARFREQNLWIAVTVVALLWHLEVLRT